MRRRRARSGWTLIVPVRDPKTGKSRLESSAALNTAIAADTVSAALACPDIRQVVLVTDDLSWIPESLTSDFRCTVLLQTSTVQEQESSGSPLNAAVTQALGNVSRSGHRACAVAIMLGDLPALHPADLGTALHAAAGMPRGMVSDHLGSGTTLITAGNVAWTSHLPCFGPDSAERHRAAGYRELPVPASSSLRRDVDTAEDLRAVHSGLGPATLHALERDQRTGPELRRAEAA